VTARYPKKCLVCVIMPNITYLLTCLLMHTSLSRDVRETVFGLRYLWTAPSLLLPLFNPAIAGIFPASVDSFRRLTRVTVVVVVVAAAAVVRRTLHPGHSGVFPTSLSVLVQLESFDPAHASFLPPPLGCRHRKHLFYKSFPL